MAADAAVPVDAGMPFPIAPHDPDVLVPDPSYDTRSIGVHFR